MANPKLQVEIVGDARKLNRTLKETETSTKRWASRLEGVSAGTALGGRGGLGSSAALLKGGGIALGAGIATQKVNELTHAASDLNEQITKSQAVFGKSASSIDRWSDTTAVSLGISKRAALEATGTFGNLFSTVGIASGPAADMSRALVGLASDLSSFNNADPSEVLDALRSGLIGEAEPLRRFGVLLSETRVQQQAMADTGKNSAKALTDQEKAFARYEIILNDTKKAQGDFARTSEGLAGQERILTAQTEDLEGKLGSKLLPVMRTLRTVENEAITATLHLGDAFSDVDQQSGGFLSGALKNVAKLQFYVNPGTGTILGGIHAINSAFGDTEARLGDVNAAAAAFAATMGGINLNPGGIPTLEDMQTKPAAKLTAFGEPGFRTAPAPAVPLGATVEQRNRWFDSELSRRLDKVQDIGTIKGQIGALTEIAGLIEQRIIVTKDITRKLNLEDQLRSVNRQRRSLGDELVSDAVERKRQQQALAQQAAATRLAQRTARQFRELGLSATGDEVTPGAANLKKRVASITGRIEGTKLDTPKLQTQLARFRKVLSEGLVPKDVRGKIKQMLDDINQELKTNASGPLTKRTQLNTNKILSGLGLSPEDERRVRARLSRFNSSGQALAAGTGSVGALGQPIIVKPADVYLDGQKISSNSRKHDTIHKRRNPKQKRGRPF